MRNLILAGLLMAVVLPAGAEIDGQVIRVSSGHVGGHGFMRIS